MNICRQTRTTGNNGKFSVFMTFTQWPPGTTTKQSAGGCITSEVTDNFRAIWALDHLKCGCGVIFLWLLKRKNTTNFKVKSQNASFKQLRISQKMWIKKKRFLCELSQHRGAVNLFYTLRFPDSYSSDIDFSTHRSLSGLSRHEVKWRGWFKLFF